MKCLAYLILLRYFIYYRNNVVIYTARRLCYQWWPPIWVLIWVKMNMLILQSLIELLRVLHWFIYSTQKFSYFLRKNSEHSDKFLFLFIISRWMLPDRWRQTENIKFVFNLLPKMYGIQVYPMKYMVTWKWR